MKNKIFLCIGLLLLTFALKGSNDEAKFKLSLKGSISVFSTPDLYKLTANWADEFCNLNPKVKIKVNMITENFMADILNVRKSLGFISNDNFSVLNIEPKWGIVIGRDIIVPIISSKNPFINEINQQGISSEEFAVFFKNHNMQQWGTLLNNKQNASVNYYMVKDKSVNSMVADFMNVNRIAINGIEVDTEKELITSIQNDPYAIGFCKMINIIDPTNQNIVDNIKLLPIDRNGNGEIDYVEKIYDNLNVLSRAVWIGKYPKTLFNNIFSVSSVQPTNEIEVAFLNWILTDGQDLLSSSGYSDLVFSERQSKVDKLYANQVDINSPNYNYAISKIIMIVLAAIAVFSFVMMFVSWYMDRKNIVVSYASSIFPKVFNEDSVVIPKGIYYDKTHTWAFMEKDGMVKIGMDDFLQHITGSLTRIQMNNVGDKIKKGKKVFTIIQKGKQLHINAPISGTIKAINNKLITNSAIINTSPYSDGWVYMIEPTNWLREIQFLIMEKKYKEWLKNEFSRLKDFLSVIIKPNTIEYSYSVLQDGGELQDGILANFGPEIWEDFQTRFIDTSK